MAREEGITGAMDTVKRIHTYLHTCVVGGDNGCIVWNRILFGDFFLDKLRLTYFSLSSIGACEMFSCQFVLC